jgi:hypothetical protein
LPKKNILVAKKYFGCKIKLDFFQTLAMQQMYAQYVNQYMQYLQSSGHPFAAAGFHPWTSTLSPAVVYDPRQAEAAANNVLEPMAAAAAAAVDGAAEANVVPAAAPAEVGGNVGPNPPNVVMNANAGGLGAIEDDEDGIGGQRDILDWFYVASRVLVNMTNIFTKKLNFTFFTI